MNDSRQLRKLFGSYDPFQLKHVDKGRKVSAGWRSGKKKATPDWCQDKEKIQQLLLNSFPKLATDANQRHRAGRWMRVIYLYFQCGYSRGMVCNEMSESDAAVKSMIQAIRSVSKGFRANRSGPKTKKSAPLYVNMGGANKDPDSGTSNAPKVVRCADLPPTTLNDRELK